MTNHWQELLVASVLLICAVEIGMKLYSFIRQVKNKSYPCDHCASGCELRGLYDKNRSECKEGTKKKKKSRG